MTLQDKYFTRMLLKKRHIFIAILECENNTSIIFRGALFKKIILVMYVNKKEVHWNPSNPDTIGTHKYSPDFSVVIHTKTSIDSYLRPNAVSTL